MNLLLWVILCISILSLLYYGLIILYAGWELAFSKFWLAFGFVGLTCACIIKYMIIRRIEVSHSIIQFLTIMVLLGLGVIIWTVGTLLFYSRKKSNQKVGTMIILGARLRGNVISKTLQKRLDTTVAYLKERPDTRVIVSGGKGEGEALSEAEAMKQFLLQRGIPEAFISLEDKSTNTYENILFSKALLKAEDRIILVTNGFHIYRSMQLAKKLDLIPQGHAAPTDKILATHYYVREAIGVLKDKCVGNI